MCHMERATVRELHLNTSALIKNVVQGATYVIEYYGKPVAELRPITERRRSTPLPDIEDFIRTLPPSNDIDRIISEGREDRDL
jgi:antitoxin (DNA-binding transcriptional repressor) of toxin-antitoxin stability system